MMFREVLAWVAFVATFCIGGGTVASLSLLIGSVNAQLFSGEPLSWPEFDLVISFGKLGVLGGFIAGTGVWANVAIERWKHEFQGPKRPHTQRTWFALMAICCAVAALASALSWLAYARFFRDKPLSLPEMGDVLVIGLAVLLLGIVVGTIIWRPPPKK